MGHHRPHDAQPQPGVPALRRLRHPVGRGPVARDVGAGRGRARSARLAGGAGRTGRGRGAGGRAALAAHATPSRDRRDRARRRRRDLAAGARDRAALRGPVRGLRARRERPPRVSLVGLAGLLALSAVNFLDDDRRATRSSRWPWRWAPGRWARRRATGAWPCEEETLRAVGEEQARIARELHDVIAHSVSVIVVQAAAADDVFDERPDQARAALRSIEGSGREAMAELRRLLSAVRPRCGARAGRPPQPGLDRLEELAEPLRAARARGRRAPRGRARGAARRGRPVGLPDRPGGADQHAAPRPRHAGRGDPALRRRTRSSSRSCDDGRAAPERAGRRRGTA